MIEKLGMAPEEAIKSKNIILSGTNTFSSKSVLKTSFKCNKNFFCFSPTIIKIIDKNV